MNRAVVVAILAFVALANYVSCDGPVTIRIDTVARKLEDHYHDAGLQDRISFEECNATLAEFDAFHQEDVQVKDYRDPLQGVRIFLFDFVYVNLKIMPSRRTECLRNKRDGEAFVNALEKAYQRFRSIYKFQSRLEDSPIGKKTLIVTDHLAGKSDKLFSRQQLIDALDELEANVASLKIITEKSDIFAHLDELERFTQYWITPEAYTWAQKIWALMWDTKKTDRYLAGDERVIKEWRQIYQDEVAKLIANNQD